MTSYFNSDRDSLYNVQPDVTKAVTERLVEMDEVLKSVLTSSNIVSLRDNAGTFEYSLDDEEWRQVLSGGEGSTGGGTSYVLELSRWEVSNDGTNAVSTTTGINNALVWAVNNGFTQVVLPLGTYLIDKSTPIEVPSYVTLNLNGSTLKKETNGFTSYAVISFKKNQEYCRVTNGKIQGDRTTHDYTTIAGTHEGGYGIELGNFNVGTNNIRRVLLDNLEIVDCTGDAVTLNSAFNQISPTPTTLANAWESGGINATTGALEVNAAKVRLNVNVSLTQTLVTQYGYFGLYGNGYGALGSDIVTDYYDVFFYRADNTYISNSTYIQFFEEVVIPAEANYAKIMLHQATVPAAANCLINVRVPTFPKHVYIEKCNFHHNRRQGISVCGAKSIYIRHNEIHHIGGNSNTLGTDPQSGIDIEDGYDLNQDIYIDKNMFHHNWKYNIIAVNGKHIFITNNSLLQTLNPGYVSLTINGGVDEAVVTGNFIKLGKVSLTGEVLFSNNYVYGTQVLPNPVYNKPQQIIGNIFHNCKYVLDSPFQHNVRTDNCRFFNDADKASNALGLSWTLELKNEPQTISNCVFEGQDYSYLTYSSAGTYKGGWRFENCRFKNTKTPAVFSGIYIGCTFFDLTGSLVPTTQTGGNDTLELRNCKFYSTDSNNTSFTFNSLKSLTIVDCYMEKTSGWLLKIGSVSGEVVIRNSTFKIVNDALARSIIILDPTFTGLLIALEGNRILATNATRIGIDNLTTNNATVVLRDNIMTKATINKNGKELLLNNIIDGVVSTGLTGTAAPTTTPQYVGQDYIDTTNKVAYKAVGTASSADWKQVSN